LGGFFTFELTELLRPNAIVDGSKQSPKRETRIMQTHTRTHGEAQMDAQFAADRNKGLLWRFFNALMERDRRYREVVRLRGMSDERLADMGITRDQADAGCRNARRQG
jgi:uncharacterized protein YjiS (DUF1127 family)